jgi:DNA-nicking Smr family endonuclease
MKRRSDISEDEAELFRKAVGDVRPVTSDRVESAPRRPSPRPRFREADEARVLKESLQGNESDVDLETGEELVYARPGLQLKLMRRLRRGRIPVRAALDLHGHTWPEAREAVAEFLAEAAGAGWYCVRIVHGKGTRSGHRGPVLKTRLNSWLRHRSDVLAFCSATPADGGTGAIYLLVRSN